MLRPEDQRAWRLIERRGGRNRLHGKFADDDVAAPADLQVANHFISTYPSHPYTRFPVVMCRGENVQWTLHRRRLRCASADDVRIDRELSEHEYAEVLTERFGLVLTEADAVELARLAAADR